MKQHYTNQEMIASTFSNQTAEHGSCHTYRAEESGKKIICFKSNMKAPNCRGFLVLNNFCAFHRIICIFHQEIVKIIK